MDITHAADRVRVRELAELFRRNFGWAVRSDEAVEAALGHPANVVLEWRERGRLMGAAVMRRNTVLMLCVDERARRQGIGSALLARCEALLCEQGYAEVSVGAGDDYLLPGVPSILPCGPDCSESQVAAQDEPHAKQGEKAHAPTGSESQGAAQDEPHAGQGREAHAPSDSEPQVAAVDAPHVKQGEEAHVPTGSEPQVAAQDEPHAGQDREAHALTGSESQVAAQDEPHAGQDREARAPTGSEPQVAADAARQFFVRRGYRHAWGECECFDMCAEFGWQSCADGATLDGAADSDEAPAGVELRWAEVRDRAATLECARAAHAPFERYYEPAQLYVPGARRALLAVEAARVVGVLIAGCGEAAAGMGGIACVAVVPERRGRGIARALVCAATGALRRAGMARGFIGYTYSGLEQLYGAAGYRISMRYFMARKPL
ncbi:MAG TPA: GNAT family N-acetyltransferase [Candidatus Fimadaptatus faecigallinarum]|uniref:GNAT family N-acetyltransferase n=1 Tax=Candidatus Fimadaptatus faecigallinarum TaxID=2840814 RepID=A0A9D1S4Z7_9FIRM|nr:GNAT family N-acetyltransferase [Candidatus Fimadaptatus faecigallinarum]